MVQVAYRRRAVFVSISVALGTLVVGLYAVVGDSDRYLMIESRPLVIGLGILFVLVGSFELLRWLWRILGGRPAIEMTDKGLIVNMIGPPPKVIPYNEIITVEDDGQEIRLVTSRGRIRFSTQNLSVDDDAASVAEEIRDRTSRV